MSIFNLPDLGEGLPDGEIHEWFVQVGDKVSLDQPLVSMETAKAVVDVPSPEEGVIKKLFGKPGDIIQTGSPLVEFEALTEVRKAVDQGTVVGNLEEDKDLGDDNFTIGKAEKTTSRAKATPMVRQLAKTLNIDLDKITGTGEHGVITKEDIEKQAVLRSMPQTTQEFSNTVSNTDGFEPLRGTRRSMSQTMTLSHQEIVPVSIFDEVSIDAWEQGEDITVRLIQAIVAAVKAEPALNTWFDGKKLARKVFTEVNLGLAMDTEDGLFVPVIANAQGASTNDLRETIDNYKKAVKDRTLKPEYLKGATFTLSNFGKFAGRFASPIIVPPTVAILGVGRLFSLSNHRFLPLSLSFDHRAVTGGEATRFLKVVMESLEAAKHAG